jgi:hypothetical protein
LDLPRRVWVDGFGYLDLWHLAQSLESQGLRIVRAERAEGDRAGQVSGDGSESLGSHKGKAL